MKIVGIWAGHDTSFCVLDDGIPIIHAELERYNREKSPAGDAIKFALDRSEPHVSDATHFTSVYPKAKVTQYDETFNKAKAISQKNGGDFHFISHHKAHAAHAFYSSNIDHAILITMDGGGVEDGNGVETAATVWLGDDVDLKHVKTYDPKQVNIGGVWTRITRYVFKLQNGWPLGSQEGTVMAMAALGDPTKYHDDFYNMLTRDLLIAGFKPFGQPKGAYVPGKDPTHPYLDKWAKIADSSEQEKFDLAASLQSATERYIREFIGSVLDAFPQYRNICLAGGVTLNSVCMGKIKKWFPDRIDQIYIPPVPYDGGLCLGSAQYHWHAVLRNPRIKWTDNFKPYLGEAWSKDDVENALKALPNNFEITKTSDKKVVDLLIAGKIIAIFNSRSESGRRALGNRSIIADPRSPDMKDKVNLKVKHRQWFRPFAPSILSDCIDDWFKNPCPSPYMQFVLDFKDEVKDKVPAVVHFDGTARLQTVSKNDNLWYYNFISMFKKKSGVPIILNTSFNDREPICETPKHAIDCFSSTNIDYLYFPEHSLLVKKNSGDEEK
jgi:carbamoyltransferase